MITTVQQLQDAGGIYIKNIQEALEQYQYQILKIDRTSAYEQFMELQEINGEEKSYVDFYYPILEVEAKRKIETLLEPSEICFIRNLSKNAKQIIYPLCSELLSIIVKLNEKQMLFSTVYFLKTKQTFWGNYNQEYILFEHK